MYIAILLLVICIGLLISTHKKLKAVTKIAGAVTDGNAYSEEKHKEADSYVTKKQNEADSYLDRKKDQADKLSKAIGQLNMDKTALEKELSRLNLDAFIQSVQIDAYENMRSEEVKSALTVLRVKQDELIKSENALKITNTAQSNKIMNSQKKQILRCFNAECTNIIDEVTAKNADASMAKIKRAYDTINKMFEVDGVQISQDYLSSKLEELNMVYAYMVKQEEEKEQQKAIREQMVEEEKVRREIEREKDKIEKEEAQFTGEVKKLMAYMQKTQDEVEKKLYLDKINDLEQKLKLLEKDKEDVLNREQNTRAGFVYIISNIGSFGESVYKIGMTRRLDPMDRINELSSASVPFTFDVHAMIFSEDAPALETTLHQLFQQFQVNKVNGKKEFFRVALEDIKKAVKENFNATVKFVDIPEAMEYRQTLRIEQDAKQVATIA